MYLAGDVPVRIIRQYARAIADEFQPDKIVLFGSYAYGTPHKDSDVDLLVIMPTANQLSQAARIQYRLTAAFSIDLIVRTPEQVDWRLAEKESFLTTIMSKGKILYEKDDPRVGKESRRGLRARRSRGTKRRSRS
jgi:predicted nucleotidyltransferase